MEEQKLVEDFSDIPGCEAWKKLYRINEGYSADEKYRVETISGESLLLRISDISEYDCKKREFEIVTKCSSRGFEMSMPLDFGTCNHGKNTFMLLTWVEGKTLSDVLLQLPEEEQYKLGLEAGSILKKIHNIPLDERDIPQKNRKEKKLTQIIQYEQSSVRIPEDEVAIQYVKDNIDKIWSESPVYTHGDFHPGNLILTPQNHIGVIDFNRWKVSDPYEEFYKLQSFGIEISIPYCIGQINGYFNDNPPEAFWSALAVYVAHASLHSIKWAEKFGQKSIAGMVERCRAAMKDYDNFTKSIPGWYQ